jgi:hypothetical protein
MSRRDGLQQVKYRVWGRAWAGRRKSGAKVNGSIVIFYTCARRQYLQLKHLEQNLRSALRDLVVQPERSPTMERSTWRTAERLRIKY